MFSFVKKNVGKNIRRYKKWSAKKFVTGKKNSSFFADLFLPIRYPYLFDV